MRKLFWLGILLSGCGGDGGSICDANQVCSSGAHYNFCNAGASGCYYAASDGSRFACTSCGDCAKALAAAQSWCESSPPPPTVSSGSCSDCDASRDSSCQPAGSDNSQCLDCCQQLHPSGYQFAWQASITCVCNSCPACAGTSYCSGTANPSEACTNCLTAGVAQSCGQSAENACAQNAACNAWWSCGRNQCNLL